MICVSWQRRIVHANVSHYKRSCVCAPCVLLAESSLRKRSCAYLPNYLRIPNALRLNG